jgi:hypothetical protein
MNPQIVELSYESYNQLLNLGSVVLFIAFWLVKVLIFYILKRTKKYPTLMKSLHNSVFYGSIISIWLETYLEFVITGALQIQKPLYSTVGEVISSLTAYISLTMVFVVPSVFAWVLYSKPLSITKTINFERKYGAFYESIKPTSKQTLATTSGSC